MELVQDMSGCKEDQKVRYTDGSFVGKDLMWWNSLIYTRSREAAVGMTWEDFKNLTREEFYPVNEMKKLEIEFWNHAMVGAVHAAYTDRFHELARLVPHLVTPEKGLRGTFMAFGTDIQEKDKKKAKNDQTKHGMEKTKSNRSQSQSKSESQPLQSQKSTK
ncbi:reverse transcriptase domain-containing protein [Tanacetum coccineum]